MICLCNVSALRNFVLYIKGFQIAFQYFLSSSEFDSKMSSVIGFPLVFYLFIYLFRLF